MDDETIPQTKILLVDDEINITNALRRLFANQGQYDILTATSGRDALTLLEEESDIGVIFSDQRMPEMTGVEFLERVKERVPDAVRILLTGYADIDASINAINRGAVFRYLTKPWNDEELLLTATEASRHFHLVTENRRLNLLVAKQNEELKNWNSRLKQRVLDQTSQIRAKNDALAISNQQLRGNLNETIATLSSLIEMRDRGAPAHSRNVADLAHTMAFHLEMDEQQTERLRIAGLLHDIGKIGVPDRYLEVPPENLEAQGLVEYRTHAIRGQFALQLVPELQEASLWVRHHHEHFDGSGFPDQLAGNDIPLGSRILAAADHFERTLRKFSSAKAMSEALSTLQPDWGTVLDPQLMVALSAAAAEVYNRLDVSETIMEAAISPKNLQPGMTLLQDIHSTNGALLLKQGTVFQENSINAVQRSHAIDPLEQKIRVLMTGRFL